MTVSSIEAAWDRIAALGARADARQINTLFYDDPNRVERMRVSLDDLTIDLSKTSISPDVREALFDLARVSDLDGFRRRLFAGGEVNNTEARAAMHMAHRAAPGEVLMAGDEDATAFAWERRERMRLFVRDVHGGTLRGATGLPFTTVLSIGIGGSDLGPSMVTEALTMAEGERLEARFLSNVDGTAFVRETRGLDPARTLILVASKSFTTAETAANAHVARKWIVDALGEDAVGAHFVALSTNLHATNEFGILRERVFGFRNWVGGRFSLWSPVGLVIALAAGWDQFDRLLAGAHAMDRHFAEADLEQNLPVLMALAGIWHVNGLGSTAHCVLPYDDRLRRFPAFLQQLEMESNGKGVTREGAPVKRMTCPVIFGEPGTNAQHSFMQMIHQGPAVIPVDFILAHFAMSHRADAHRMLSANAIAQAEALLCGKTAVQAEMEMLQTGMDPVQAAFLAPHRAFPGDRPSIFISMEHLDAYGIGRLIALYEHKVAVQGHLWDVNSFDQWGVEFGKALATGILAELSGDRVYDHDPSTSALIATLHDV